MPGLFGKPQEWDEAAFLSAYRAMAEKHGLSPDPDEGFYDYRAAYRAGEMEPDKAGHFSSAYKRLGHPRLIVDRMDTRTGQALTVEDVLQMADDPGVIVDLLVQWHNNKGTDED